MNTYDGASPPAGTWRLITNHGMVLFYVAANPAATVRQISDDLLITERQVTRILRDLQKAELLDVTRVGRRNSYTVRPDAHFRHPALSQLPISSVLDAITGAIAASGEESDSS